MSQHAKDIAQAALNTSIPAAGSAATYQTGGDQIVTALGLTLAEWSFAVTILVGLVNVAYLIWKWRRDATRGAQ